jgi:RNA polymerase sigma factor (sigma-70 family)
MGHSPAAVVLRAIRSAASAGGGDESDRELLRRFATSDDQAAFAALVRRHGGMVLGVCRRALPTVQDAEDACQAAFLLLARKAGSNRWQQSVANWLYATARNVSRKARQTARRRSRREARVAVPEAIEPVDRMTGRELLAALDEELDRLPAHYREPLVLCYLEGLTRDEVAARLGVPPATVKTRLERGRKRLADTLTKRGCALGIGLLALAATSPAGASPPRLVEAVLAAVTGPAPAAVAALARGVAVQGIVKKALIAMLVVGAGALVGVASWPMRPAVAQSPGDRAMMAGPSRSGSKPKQAAEQLMTLSGRVLDPQGKPLPGANVLLVGKGPRPVELGTTGNDGRFRVQIPGGSPNTYSLAARAGGTGIDFVGLSGLDPARAVELRLVKDHPIRGRVVDTQGKPVAAVRVTVARIDAFDGGSVDTFLAAWMNRMVSWQSPAGDKLLWRDPGVVEAVTTDAAGKFTLAGIGAERVVLLHVSGAGIADGDLRVVNREGFDPRPVNESARSRSPVIFSGPETNPPPLYGPEPAFVTEPGKVLRGVVRDADTGKPRPGVEVHCHGASVKTDAAGHFEFRGLAKAGSYALWVHTDLASGVLGRPVTVPDSRGYEPVRADVPVSRVTQTTVLTGRLTDAATGKGVRGEVHVGILADNAFARAHPELEYIDSVSTAEDGTYRIVTIPGAVLLMGSGSERYRPAAPDPGYPRYFSDEHSWWSYRAVGGALRPVQGNFCKVLQIKPDTAVVKQDIVLEPASTITVKVQDADGRPLAGAFVDDGRAGAMDHPTRCQTDTWVACGVAESRRPRRMIFYDRGRKLFGTLTLKGAEKGPVAVRLRPCGAVRGRLVAEDGKPLAGINVNATYYEGRFWSMHAFIHGARPVFTDANGAFAIDELIPGTELQLWPRSPKRGRHWPLIANTLKVEPGRTTDLGDVRLRPAN